MSSSFMTSSRSAIVASTISRTWKNPFDCNIHIFISFCILETVEWLVATSRRCLCGGRRFDVGCYLSVQSFVAPADLISLFFLFPSHELTYVPNVFLSLVLIVFSFFFVRYPSWLIRAAIWAIGFGPLCGCTEFA